MIKIDKVSKVFSQAGRRVAVLENLNLELHRSEFVTILGRSGAGKSILLDLVMGLSKPTSGTITRESDITIGYVFQRAALLPWRTVFRNVELPLEIKGESKAVSEDRARWALDMVGMSFAAKSYPFQLSGGMAQRVGIARALVQDPDLLLMDEPFSALDPILRDNLNVNLLKLWEKTQKTFLFVTHSINEAVILSQRILVLERGHILCEREIDIPYPRGFETFQNPKFVRISREIREILPIQPNLPRYIS